MTWATIDDAVGENRPIGFFRGIRSSVWISIDTVNCGFEYELTRDEIGRLTGIIPTRIGDTTCGVNGAVYDAWDEQGRPTHGTEYGVGIDPCQDQEVSIAYDDGNRIITRTRSGDSDCSADTDTSTYDQDGIQTSSNVGTDSYTYVTLETAEICVN
jgi:hypothetical protein